MGTLRHCAPIVKPRPKLSAAEKGLSVSEQVEAEIKRHEARKCGCIVTRYGSLVEAVPQGVVR